MTTPDWNRHREGLTGQYRWLEDVVRLKLMPAFGDIDKKLEAYSAKLDEQHIESDEPSFQEGEYSQKREYFQEGEYKAELYALLEDELRSAQSDMAAFAVATLYHHWERSVKWLIARKKHPSVVNELDKAEFKKLKVLLEYELLPDDCKDAFCNLNLGRLIANVIKHGKGPSERELRSIAPSFFERPWNDEHFDLPSDHGVNLIWVQPMHVDVIATAIRQFWETLPDSHFPQTPPFTRESMLNGDFD